MSGRALLRQSLIAGAIAKLQDGTTPVATTHGQASQYECSYNRFHVANHKL